MSVADIKSIAILAIISLIGSGALLGVFNKMQKGFGVFNLRAVGIPLIVTFASLLGVQHESSMNAVIGIFGAILGYLFGLQDKPRSQTD